MAIEADEGLRRRRLAHRKILFVIAAFIMFASLALHWWSDIEPPNETGFDRGILVELMGYTNDVRGMRSGVYSGTNATTGRFAVFRIDNARFSSEQCIAILLFYNDPDRPDEEFQSTELVGATPFVVSPTKDVLIAIPEPRFHGEWKIAILLSPARSWSRWPRHIRRTLNRFGIETSDTVSIIQTKYFKVPESEDATPQHEGKQ